MFFDIGLFFPIIPLELQLLHIYSVRMNRGLVNMNFEAEWDKSPAPNLSTGSFGYSHYFPLLKSFINCIRWLAEWIDASRIQQSVLNLRDPVNLSLDSSKLQFFQIFQVYFLLNMPKGIVVLHCQLTLRTPTKYPGKT